MNFPSKQAVSNVLFSLERPFQAAYNGGAHKKQKRRSLERPFQAAYNRGAHKKHRSTCIAYLKRFNNYLLGNNSYTKSVFLVIPI